jgi:hypothetical protein
MVNEWINVTAFENYVSLFDFSVYAVLASAILHWYAG